jgi:hypothetical protein
MGVGALHVRLTWSERAWLEHATDVLLNRQEEPRTFNYFMMAPSRLVVNNLTSVRLECVLHHRYLGLGADLRK